MLKSNKLIVGRAEFSDCTYSKSTPDAKGNICRMSFYPFLSDTGIPGVQSMGPSVSNKLTDYTFLKLN